MFECKHVIKTDKGYIKKVKYVDDLLNPYYKIDYTKNVNEAKAYKRFGMVVNMATKWFHPVTGNYTIEVVGEQDV